MPSPRSSDRALFAALAAAATLFASLPRVARAEPINGERYLVCRHERGERAAPQSGAAPEPVAQRRRVKKRAAPPKLAAAPTPVIDVPSAEPLPSREVSPRPLAAALARVVTAERQDFRCTGFVRGARGVLSVLSEPPGAKFAGHPYAASWIEDNIAASGSARLEGAKPYLRRELDRVIPSGLDPAVRHERLRLKTAAARALADLGDVSAAGAIEALAHERETADSPMIWEDLVESLARLDARKAEVYAVAVLDRAAKSAAHDTAEENRVREVLPLVVNRSAASVRVLTDLSSGVGDDPSSPGRHETCLVLAARIRAGDDALRDAVRAEVATDIRTQRAAHCYSQLIAAAFPGDDPSEVDTLLFRQRYDELLRLASTMRRRERQGSATSDDAVAKRKILAWLDERDRDDDIANASDRGVPFRSRRALHLALGAAFARPGVERELYALIDDPRDDTVAPWVAARAALDLDLVGAADHAAARLLIARTQHTSTVAHGEWASRGRVTVTEHVDVVDRLAARGDVRFALGLLDRQGFARQAAFEHLSRLRPKSACAVVTDAALGAQEKSIQDAFWALTVLGDVCRDPMRRLARDNEVARETRGMALEHLAMIRDGSVAADLARDPPSDDIRPARQRARLIESSPLTK